LTCAVSRAFTIGDLRVTDTGADVLIDNGSGTLLVEGAAGTTVLDAGDFIVACQLVTPASRSASAILFIGRSR
jgi:hypothetical protein